MSSFEKAPISGAFVSQVPPSYGEKMNSPQMKSESKADKMFKSNSWRDLWAAILYYVHLGGVAVILGLNFMNLKKFELLKGENDSGQLFQSIGIIGISLLVASVLLFAFLSLVNKFPSSMIKGTFISTIVLLAMMGIGMFFVPGGSFAGLMYLVLALLNTFIYFSWRKRIPFSATLLKTVIDVMKIYPNTWNLSIFAIFGQAAFSAFYLVTLASIGLKYSDKSGEQIQVQTGDILASLYVVFSMYWSMQVIENVVHTSVCGVFGTFYFLHGTGSAIIKPVWNSFSRSMTYSFGSIAFGSLIVAAIQFVRFLINSTRNDRDNIAAACADCLIGMIESLVRYFNYYAYVHVAIYGKPFIESGKDTWELIKSHGVDVIINDSLVGNCMSVATLLIGLTCGLIAYLIGLSLSLTDPLLITVTIISFLFTFMISAVATRLLESGVSATLVCYAEDPSALQRSKPELYREITSSYQTSFL